MEQTDRLNYLLNNLIAGTATEEELEELTDRVKRDGEGSVMPEIESLLQAGASTAVPYDKERWMEVAEKILAADKTDKTRKTGDAGEAGNAGTVYRTGNPDNTGKTGNAGKSDKESTEQAVIRPFRRNPLRRYGWAAAVVTGLLITGALIWLQQTRDPMVSHKDVAHMATNIEPGKEGAILTLADGRKVVLDDLNNGVVAIQTGARVVLRDGRLIYDPSAVNDSTAAYNTINTPKGRQFNVTLPDGTRIWLNAASSLRYPTVFTGTDRRVEVRGEAYFEVAPDSRSPFLIKVNDSVEIEVLGTSFNVNAYTDESRIKTTLIEGSVRVHENESQVLLKPGQQARIENRNMPGRLPGAVHSPISVVNMKEAEIDKAIAWKKGVFNFEGAGLDEVMRQLERWYDIEVVYEKGIPDIEFGGEMSRNLNLDDLLRVLKASEVNFRMDKERKLIVYP